MTQKNLKVNTYSRQSLKIYRDWRKANPTLKDLLKSINFKETIMSRNDAHNSKLKEKFLKEQTVENTARSLYDQYYHAGVNWGACVQAALTDHVAQFQVKWAEKSRSLKD